MFVLAQDTTLVVVNRQQGLITLVSVMVIPMLVAVLTRAQASAGLKSILNVLLSALASVLQQLIPGTFEWVPFFVNWLVTFVFNVGVYYGFYKPTQVAPALNRSTGSFGIG